MHLVVSWRSQWSWSQDATLCPVREERLAPSSSPWAPWHSQHQMQLCTSRLEGGLPW